MAQGWSQYPAEAANNGAADVEQTAVFSGIPANPPIGKVPGKRLRLETGSQIRREMTRVYRDMKAGVVNVAKGTKLIYALTELGRAVEREGVERLAERLDAMEGQ